MGFGHFANAYLKLSEGEKNSGSEVKQKLIDQNLQNSTSKFKNQTSIDNLSMLI